MKTRNPGTIYQLKDGRFAIAYNKEQKYQFAEAKKLYVHIIQDLEKFEPVLDKYGNPLKVLKRYDTFESECGKID